MINTHPSPVSPLVTAHPQFDEVRVARATVKAALPVDFACVVVALATHISSSGFRETRHVLTPHCSAYRIAILLVVSFTYLCRQYIMRNKLLPE
jgi:hypothetical protein